MNIEQLISEDEGKRLRMYQDTKDIWTVGIGRNMQDRDISEEVCSLMFKEDLEIVLKDANTFSWFNDLNDVRQAVILNMLFNMGLTRFRGFKKTIKFIKNGSFMTASVEMLDSKWAKIDVSKHRSNRLSLMMRTGEWQ